MLPCHGFFAASANLVKKPTSPDHLDDLIRRFAGSASNRVQDKEAPAVQTESDEVAPAPVTPTAVMIGFGICVAIGVLAVVGMIFF